MSQKQQAQPPAKQESKPNLPAVNISEKLVGRLAQQYGVEATMLLKTLRDTVFQVKGEPFSEAELAAALTICEKYQLNPFAREIYVTRNNGALLVIVPIDGWTKIANRQPSYDGCEFEFVDKENGDPYSCTCRIFRKDRGRPTEVTEFFDECFRPTDPWKKWRRRMLRHKTFIQGIRLAFSLSEAVDDDEAERIRSRTPEFHVRSEPEAEVRLPPRRKPPKEVSAKAAEPEQATDEDEEMKTALLKDFWQTTEKFTADELKEVRAAAGVGQVGKTCTLEQLEAALRKASEIAQGERE